MAIEPVTTITMAEKTTRWTRSRLRASSLVTASPCHRSLDHLELQRPADDEPQPFVERDRGAVAGQHMQQGPLTAVADAGADGTDQTCRQTLTAERRIRADGADLGRQVAGCQGGLDVPVGPFLDLADMVAVILRAASQQCRRSAESARASPRRPAAAAPGERRGPRSVQDVLPAPAGIRPAPPGACPRNVCQTQGSACRAGQTIIWRAVGGIGRGSLVEPDRYSSTPAAQARPSAMAQTISD